MKRIPIERKNKLSPAEIIRDHVQGIGKPVIVTDATESWPARSRWTFEFFKTSYGSDMVSAPLGLFGGVAKVTKLAAYLDHLNTPTEELPGFWVDSRDLRP